ncbi:MAG: hypothetical protein VKK62_11725 [Synechococcaceae cyanobacterium]|nr:hypothetical protein [Synechococcaceae cyanobacterium]
MTSIPAGYRRLAINIPAPIYNAFAEAAKRDRRTLTNALQTVLERHLGLDPEQVDEALWKQRLADGDPTAQALEHAVQDADDLERSLLPSPARMPVVLAEAA